MERQLELFQKIKEKPDLNAESHSKEYYLMAIAKEEYLWDMRAWRNSLRDPKEVEEWVIQETPDSKNCGHIGWCIMQLKMLGVPKEEIISAILANSKVKYSKRLVPCMLADPAVYCERFKETNCFGETCRACK
jgi:hypothetical protein